MGWGAGQWKEWTCEHCSCKGNPYSKHYCKRCNAPWWVKPKPNVPSSKGESASNKWEAGMPQWMKGQKPGANTKPADKKETLTRCLQILGDFQDMEETKIAIQCKLREVAGEDTAKDAQKELEEAKELSKLMAKQTSLQKAIDSLKEAGEFQEEVEAMQEKLDLLEQTIKEKTKKPAEERIRSIQDKRAHRIKIQEKLDKELEAAEETLKDLREKDADNKEELSSLSEELDTAMVELRLTMDAAKVAKISQELAKESAAAQSSGLTPDAAGMEVDPPAEARKKDQEEAARKKEQEKMEKAAAQELLRQAQEEERRALKEKEEKKKQEIREAAEEAAEEGAVPPASKALRERKNNRVEVY